MQPDDSILTTSTPDGEGDFRCSPDATRYTLSDANQRVSPREVVPPRDPDAEDPSSLGLLKARLDIAGIGDAWLSLLPSDQPRVGDDWRRASRALVGYDQVRRAAVELVGTWQHHGHARAWDDLFGCEQELRRGMAQQERAAEHGRRPVPDPAFRVWHAERVLRVYRAAIALWLQLLDECPDLYPTLGTRCRGCDGVRLGERALTNARRFGSVCRSCGGLGVAPEFHQFVRGRS